MNARDWKQFYALERESLGESGLFELFDRAPHIDISRRGALIFPHTRLVQSGHLVAGAARAAVESGASNILALGVLHRKLRDDPTERRIHGPAVEVEEFSLDNFRVLVDLWARHLNRVTPNIIARYPFQTEVSPRTLPGFDELQRLTAYAVIVATTDPIHHGAGYNWPVAEQLPRESESTRKIARAWITEAFDALHQRDYELFQHNALRVRSDFRDVGPALAELIDFPNLQSEIVDLALVDYADVLQSPQPTWVAGGAIRVDHASSNS